MKSIVAAIVVLGATLACAENHMVTLGVGGFVYNPNTITAVAGDTVEFVVTGAHSVSEAAFSAPCQYLSGGAWSGVSPQPNFVINITDSSSRYFYCTIVGHCQGGMVFAINPSSDQSFSAFQSAAEMTTSSQTPPGNPPVGGFSGPVPSSSPESSSTTESSSAATSSSTAAESSTATSSAAESSSTEAASSSAAAETSTTAAGSSSAAAGSTSAPAPSASATNAVTSAPTFTSGAVATILSGQWVGLIMLGLHFFW